MPSSALTALEFAEGVHILDMQIVRADRVVRPYKVEAK